MLFLLQIIQFLIELADLCMLVVQDIDLLLILQSHLFELLFCLFDLFIYLLLIKL